MKFSSRFSPIRVTLLTILLVAVSVPALSADHPFSMTSSLNANTPFTMTLPSTLPNGKPVKTVVIEFVTADCFDAAGVTQIGSAQIRTLFAGNFAYYTLTFAPVMAYVNNSEFALTHQTLIYADGGSVLNFGLSAGQPTCTVVLSGELIPQ